MGRNAGGVNNYAKGGSGNGVAVTSTGKRLTKKQVQTMQKTAVSTGGMKHRDMEKQINRAISRYEAVMGIRERSIKLADIPGAYGVTYIVPTDPRVSTSHVSTLISQRESLRLTIRNTTMTVDLRTSPTELPSTL